MAVYAILGVLASLLLGMSGGFLAYLLGPVLKTLGGHEKPLLTLPFFSENWNIFNYLPWFLWGGAFVKTLSTMGQIALWEQAAETWVARKRARFLRLFLALKTQKLIHGEEIRAASVFSQDFNRLKDFIVSLGGSLVRESTLVFCSGIMLFWISWKLSLFFLGILMPGAVIVHLVKKRWKLKTEGVLDSLEELGEWIQQRFSGLETIQQLRSQDQEMEKFDKLGRLCQENFLRAARTKIRVEPLLEWATNLGLLGIVSLLFWKNELGELGTWSFLGLLILFMPGIASLGRCLGVVLDGHVSWLRWKSSQQWLQTHGRSPSFQNISPPEENLREDESRLILKNVGLMVQGRQLFSHMNHVFRKRNFYIIFGPSGIGKSTLMKAMAGLVSVDEGLIWRKPNLKVGYWRQGFVWAAGPLGPQIVAPHPWDNRSQKKLKKLLEKWPWDQRLLEGEQNPSSFSGGESQTLWLLRALYHRWDLALVDEGTSALDPQKEKQVRRMWAKLAKEGMTVILLCHRSQGLSSSQDQCVLKFTPIGLQKV